MASKGFLLPTRYQRLLLAITAIVLRGFDFFFDCQRTLQNI
jgi:hypothetical protein